MDVESLRQVTSDVRSDINDELEVFLYSNLSTIVSPDPKVLLSPDFQAGLQIALNGVGIRHGMDLPRDLKDVLDVFIITFINIIAVDTTP